MYYFFLSFPSSLPPALAGDCLWMCQIVTNGGEKPSKFHEGNSSQMLVGVGKEQVCQNPKIQMGLWAGKGGGGKTTQMCWGLYLLGPRAGVRRLPDPEMGAVSPTPVCQAPPSLEPSPFNTQTPL